MIATGIPKPNRPLFAQPVSMKCTSAQIKFIYKPLSVLGYFEDIIDFIERNDALCTNFKGKPMMFGRSTGLTDWNRVHLLEYDHECFLAIAAMTLGEKFISGEYGKLGENIFQVGQVNNLRNLLYVCEVNQWVPANEMQKPTAIELLTFFKMPYDGRTAQPNDELPRSADLDAERDALQP